MPGIGDQHRATTATDNPFDEVKPHINEYTASEIATLSSRLEKQLGPEFISTRPGASGTRVPYLAADKAINLANEVFGFNGWSSCIKQIQIDFVDESQGTGKVSLGLSVIVRVTLRDGTYHEVRSLTLLLQLLAQMPQDIGYGHIENCKGKAAAFEKAKKEGTTDGMKRALRNFGNILGNCVYDKDFVAKVSKIKVAPSRWDPGNLHRHPDYLPLEKEPAVHQDDDPPRVKSEKSTEYVASEIEDEFATDDFDEVDFSVSRELNPGDETLAQTMRADSGESTLRNEYAKDLRPPRDFSNALGQRHPNGNGSLNAGQQHYQRTHVAQDQALQYNNISANQPKPLPHNTSTTLQAQQQAAGQHGSPPGQRPSLTGTPPLATSSTISSDPPMGFFTARAAESMQRACGPMSQAPFFNPHLESPSIRKTAGVDHSKTKPVTRDLVGAPPPQPAGPGRPNYLHPQADKARRVGMPPAGGAGPLSNRTSYKPPQIKRPAEGNPMQQSREALGDVTSTTVNMLVDTGGDVKRQRIGDSLHQGQGQDQGIGDQ
ncbi:MAG: hypothetical protein Q9182_003683 [Xanthomendoza sp. 2 TL-2023]